MINYAMALTVLGCVANVCLLITIVVFFNSFEFGPPGDFGGTLSSVGLEGF